MNVNKHENWQVYNWLNLSFRNYIGEITPYNVGSVLRTLFSTLEVVQYMGDNISTVGDSFSTVGG